MANDEPDRFDFERIKLAVDSIKHITTLTTGTLVLLVAFLDKLPKPIIRLNWLIFAVICLLLCLTASFIYLFRIGVDVYPLEREGSRQRRILRPLSAVIYFTFLFAMYGVGVVAVRNLWVSK
jgi:hypothetical protein